jgi:hypothetical protein
MNAGKIRSLPPVVRLYRAVLLAVIVLLWVLVVVLLASQAEPFVEWLKSAILAMHKAWIDMDWSLT